MIRRRSTLLVLISAVAVFALTAPTASAGTVTIKGPRGGQDIVRELSELTAQFDVDASYEIRGSSDPARSEPIRGISIDALFKAVNADPTYVGVNVLRPNGGSVFISKAQVTAGAPSPVIYESGGEIRFLRPSYNAQDNNANDLVSSGGNLVLQQTADTNLKITAKASKTKAKAREAVKFTATVAGIGAGEQYEVSWLFDDGKSGKGEEVSHRYSKRGTYQVLATVKTAGSGLSSSAVVVVQIGKPVKSDKKRSGGGNNDASGAPDSGASDGQSGSGDSAATDTTTQPKQRRKQQQPQVDNSLTPITGQLLDPNATPTPEQQSELAARSGTQTDPQKQDSAAGIPGEAVGIAGALGLLGFGFILELGAFARFRSRFSLGG